MQDKPITPDSVKAMLLPLEPSVVELCINVKKLSAVLSDLRSYYFEALADEENPRYYKHYFDGAKTRQEIADDYAHILCTLVDTLDKGYSEMLSNYCS